MSDERLHAILKAFKGTEEEMYDQLRKRFESARQLRTEEEVRSKMIVAEKRARLGSFGVFDGKAEVGEGTLDEPTVTLSDFCVF